MLEVSVRHWKKTGGRLTKLINNLVSTYQFMAHLSKRPIDLKQIGTQEKTPFLVQFSMPFHIMVCPVLMRVLASKTTEY